MKTITFYSYKGGTGRSLALANAARYLARLEFRVVAVDFDLEAPGLHYKFALSPDGKPLPVNAGVIDYLHDFVTQGKLPKRLDEFVVDVTVPGIDKPLIQLIPAGRVPSTQYFSKLGEINWHELFYSDHASGVQLVLELKTQIMDELNPDFLLVDSRTGITEMGGAATTLLADNVICFVLPTPENLEGARAVLRSLKRSRRETGSDELDVTVALGRLPEMEHEPEVLDRIRSSLNEEAEDPRDTLSCSDVFVLHSETALQVRESLRVGSEVSPDDSVLLRDYLRLFVNLVPRGLVESNVGKLITQAKMKIWDDAEAALKEVEELAESFGHPEIYRELLRFYEVRNIRGPLALRRAQRLWELTMDSHDAVVWEVVQKSFKPRERWRAKQDWRPNMEFLVAVWRDAGEREIDFAQKLADAYVASDRESKAADILLEVIKKNGPSVTTVSRCIELLDVAKRQADADRLIQEMKTELGGEAIFIDAWGKHRLRTEGAEIDEELLEPPTIDLLTGVNPGTAARVYLRAGITEQAQALADAILRKFAREPPSSGQEAYELGELFGAIGRWDEFEEALGPRLMHLFPQQMIDELRTRYGARRRRR